MSLQSLVFKRVQLISKKAQTKVKGGSDQEIIIVDITLE